MNTKGATLKAYEYIRNKILNGGFKTNNPILEQDIARKLKVSRTPVKRAILLLENEGLVESHWKKGSLVKSISLEDTIESYDIRAVLEGFAARMLVSAITEEQLVELEGIVKGYSGKSTIPDEVEFKFHESLVRFTGNRQLEKIMRLLQVQIKTFKGRTSHKFPPVDNLVFTHHQILEALRKRNSELAGATAYNHVIEAKENFLGEVAGLKKTVQEN